ncbi:hypothetical protein RCIP0055_00070 [Klebsiella phage RCIP0055]|uniref:hypothetical protein n=1 Tax=Klebsiella phage 1611E-K2-1 TaxID=2047786 RepID=UPI00233F40EC|nr:hypothetical protein PQZ65_gp49 [Klebsiella phage 1611E-K2-1]
MGRTTEDIAKTLLEMQPDSTLDQIELTVEEACQLGKDYIELLRKYEAFAAEFDFRCTY